MAPAASMTVVAGAWLTPMAPDQRAGLLTAAAALSAFAAIVRRDPAPVPARPQPERQHEIRERSPQRHALRDDSVEDLAAIIAAW